MNGRGGFRIVPGRLYAIQKAESWRQSLDIIVQTDTL